LAVDDGRQRADARSEDRVRRLVQLVLRAGLALAFVLMATGFVLRLAEGRESAPAVRLFQIGRPSRADAIMAVGVLVLALTPAVRVLSLIVLWAHERDWRYVRVAIAVLVVLVAAALVGHG
jgi:uncharacterized membrane protein